MEVFKKYKQVWLFLLKFVLVYFLGLYVYQQYIQAFLPVLDPFSQYIAELVTKLLQLQLPNINLIFNADTPIATITYKNVPVISIIEGCNATSVAVLFLAFIVAFKSNLKAYLWFVPLGLLLLFVANIIRIWLLAEIVLYFYSLTNFAHDYLFPGIIYGMVFLLWLFWVKFIVPRYEAKN